MGSILTKTQLADELGISRARVSQYVARGMPTRSDGRLNREASLAWIANNVEPGYAHGRGASRAASTSTASPRPNGSRGLAEPLLPGYLRQAMPLLPRDIDIGATIVGAEMAYRFPCTAAVTAASFAGLPLKMAYALWCALHDLAVNEVIAIMREHRLEPFYSDEDAKIWLGEPPNRPDWEKLASEAGEPYDLPGWKAYLEEREADSERRFGAAAE